MSVVPQQRHRVGHAHVGPLLGVGDVVPVDVVTGVGHAIAGRHGPQPARPLGVALGNVMEHHTHRPFLAGNHGPPLGLRTRLGQGDGRIVRGRKLVGQGGGALTRHGAPPFRSTAPHSSRPGGHPSDAACTAKRCKRALTGVATPWSAPRRTTSPFRNSASIEPVPRARLCQLDPPVHSPERGGAQLKVVGPPLPVLLGRGHLDGGGGQRRRCPLAEPPWSPGCTDLGPAQRLGGVGQVHEELAVLPAHDVGPGHRLERGGVEGIGDVLPHGIDPGGIAAEVQQARDRAPSGPGSPRAAGGWPGT